MRQVINPMFHKFVLQIADIKKLHNFVLICYSPDDTLEIKASNWKSTTYPNFLSVVTQCLLNFKPTTLGSLSKYFSHLNFYKKIKLYFDSEFKQLFHKKSNLLLNETETIYVAIPVSDSNYRELFFFLK